MRFLLFAVFFGLAISTENPSIGKEEFEAIQNDVDKVKKGIKFDDVTDVKDVCYDQYKLGCFSTSRGPMAHVGLLPMSPSQIDTKFHIYINYDPDEQYNTIDFLDPSYLNYMPYFNKDIKVAFIIHGWNMDALDHALNSLKNSILKKVNMAIFVDWHKGADGLTYAPQAVNTELVGRQIAVFVDNLITNRNLEVKNVHLVGFSLGAQVAGFAGRWLIEKFKKKFGRISALDAAAPLFESYPGSYLTYEHADFVDAIHTSAGNNILYGEVGFKKPFGHVDFYPNGGTNQPRCSDGKGSFDKSCNHNSAVHYYDAAIRAFGQCYFLSYKCSSYQDFTAGQCPKFTSRLGYDSIHFNFNRGLGNQYLNTSRNYPYCLE